MVQSKRAAASLREAPIKTALKILAAVVLGLALLIGAVVGYGTYANFSAEEAAKNLCAKLQIGSDVDRAMASARAQGARHRGPLTGEDGRVTHDFEFQGWVFNVGVCRATVAGGKIQSFEAKLEGD
jgi:hypothetical protein